MIVVEPDLPAADVSGRGRILREARLLFTAQGYAAVSMQQIADAAAVNKATLYHHFRDKEDLFLSVMVEEFGRLATSVGAVIAEGGTPARPAPPRGGAHLCLASIRLRAPGGGPARQRLRTTPVGVDGPLRAPLGADQPRGGAGGRQRRSARRRRRPRGQALFRHGRQPDLVVDHRHAVSGTGRPAGGDDRRSRPRRHRHARVTCTTPAMPAASRQIYPARSRPPPDTIFRRSPRFH